MSQFPLRLASCAFGIALLAACHTPPPKAMPSTQILFVCDHGNVKSVMAMSYFNELATQRSLPFRAVSRGVAVDADAVPPGIASRLLADGFDVSAFRPTPVKATDVSASLHVVTIVTELPAAAQSSGVSVERWNDVPPASADYAASRSSLKSHVRKLIDQLTNPETE